MNYIPDHVDLAGCSFKVDIVPLDNGDYGRLEFETRRIVLNKNHFDDHKLMEDTLRHEMLHAALAMSGLSWCEGFNEEAVTRCLENLFFPAWEKLQTT